LNGEVNLEQAPPANKRERLQWEKELLGLYITSHPLEKFAEKLKEKTFPIADIGHYVARRVRVGGVISRTKKILTKNGNPMLFATIEDRTDKIEVVVFPNSFRKHSQSLQEENVVLICGKVDMKDGTPKLICEEVEELDK
jgi:DNA polymerase-3 subunit alpha